MISASSPFSLLLFGASGHLAKLKIYPSLYVLALKKRLPKQYAIVGYARTDHSQEEFRALVKDAIKRNMIEVNEKVLSDFLEHVHYRQGAYDDEKDFRALAKDLKVIESRAKKWVRLAYLSVPPQVFTSISKNLCAGGVNTTAQPVRIIVEKPVGHDLRSFEALRKNLLGCFREEHIFLLDHWLGKEAVRNIYYLRFANPIVERLLKNTLIHHVEITASEAAGLEGRAGYYEHTGALRDMFQSHLLMVMSLLTMRILESNESLTHARFDALEQIYIPPAANLDDVVLQGQYLDGVINGEAVEGYRGEDDVAGTSDTNTFACMKLLSRTSRWQGVPFFLRSGKRLSKKETRISIAFQKPRPLSKGMQPNRLDIILQGEAGMRFHLQTKLGGSEPAFRPLLLEDPLVCMGDCLPEHALLLLEAIAGRREWFLSFEEVRTAWRIIGPIQSHLDRKDASLFGYNAGSNGPEEMEEWIEREGVEWMS